MTSRKPTPDAVRAWVDASCATQALPVKVTDGSVVARVAALLGAAPPAGGAPSGPPPASELPDGAEAAGIETVEAAAGRRSDDQVVEDSGDDRVLPGQGEGFPEAA
jgi:hypothetical protein